MIFLRILSNKDIIIKIDFFNSKSFAKIVHPYRVISLELVSIKSRLEGLKIS